MHIREAEVAALELVGQALVIDAKKMKERGLEIVDVDGIFHGVESEVIGCAVGDTGLDSTSGHPNGEGVGMMIAAPTRAVVEIPLDKRSSSKLTAPNNQGVVEQTAHLEISD
jgi:hypothetical protein